MDHEFNVESVEKAVEAIPHFPPRKKPFPSKGFLLFLPHPLHPLLKVRAREEGRSMTQVVIAAIREYLGLRSV